MVKGTPVADMVEVVEDKLGRHIVVVELLSAENSKLEV